MGRAKERVGLICYKAGKRKLIYKALFTPQAAKSLKKLPSNIRNLISRKIDTLLENPFPYNSEKLKGYQSLHKTRVGDYRIIYQVEQESITIVIVRIGHRREVYQKLHAST
ncbi:MAG: type II toxin-antitoxin system RelE/ParE family toxin [Pseudomonadota bacterium]